MTRGNGISGVFQRRVKPLPWLLIFIFVLLSAAIAVSGYFYYQKLKNNVLGEQTAKLQVIADLKASEIQNWLRERLGNARLIVKNPSLNNDLLTFLRDRERCPCREAIHIWMDALRNTYHYQNILLLDGNGNVILALTDNSPAISSEELEMLEAVRRGKKVIVSNLNNSKEDVPLYLDVVAPILAADVIAGFVFLRIDPAEKLFPMIQSWPTPSSTAETLLVRRDGKNVLFLNQLRHRKNTAMKLRVPIRDSEISAVHAITGRTRVKSGRDYRGVAVLSVARPVAGTDWYVVAKVDRSEVERPIRRATQLVFLLALSLVLAVALLVLFLWQRQTARFRRRQLEAENQHQALVQHFDYLSRYANDIILLFDSEMNILEANERAIITYGYGGKALLKMNLRDLLPTEEKDKLTAQMKQMEEKLGLIFETIHQKKDGSIFPVEVSSRMIAVQNKKYFQSIVRDISERKRDEDLIRTSLTEKEVLLKEVHHRVKNNLMTIIGLIKMQETKANNKFISSILQELEGRVRSMAQVHESLHKSKDLARVDLQDYIETMIGQIRIQFGAERAIDFRVQAEGVEVSLDIAVPCGLILNELITNAFKHAFPGGIPGTAAGNCGIDVNVTRQGSVCTLTVADNGVGLPADLDWEKSETLGLRLIKMLSQQIGCSIKLDRSAGTAFHMRFTLPFQCS
ncbi:MAG: histidine kinase dimerization/phosphoacceptor domain -containing protein [Chrysiogenia bacterium]